MTTYIHIRRHECSHAVRSWSAWRPLVILWWHLLDCCCILLISHLIGLGKKRHCHECDVILSLALLISELNKMDFREDLGWMKTAILVLEVKGARVGGIFLIEKSMIHPTSTVLNADFDRIVDQDTLSLIVMCWSAVATTNHSSKCNLQLIDLSG